MRNIYYGILARCNNPKHKSYGLYGARGIRCEWETYTQFVADMSPRPTTGTSPVVRHTLDRIDNNGNYCKANCRWALPEEQSANRRVNVYILHNGRRITQAAAYKSIGLYEPDAKPTPTKRGIIHTHIPMHYALRRALGVDAQTAFDINLALTLGGFRIRHAYAAFGVSLSNLTT